MMSRKFHVFSALVISSVLLLATLLVQTQRFASFSPQLLYPTTKNNLGNVSAAVVTTPLATLPDIHTIATFTTSATTTKPVQKDVKTFPDLNAINSAENEIGDTFQDPIKKSALTNSALKPSITRETKVGTKPQSLPDNRNIFIPSSAVDFIYGMINTHLARDAEEERELEAVSAQFAKGTFANRVHHLLIFSYFRGGTTFFSELLSELPGAFLHFEPLHFLSRSDQVERFKATERAVTLVRDLLKCKFDDDFVKYASKAPNDFILSRHQRMWNYCKMHPPLCARANFWSEACQLYTKYDIHLNIMKLVRLRLRHAKTFLDEFPDLQVIHLVRDPRALYASRRTLPWCQQTQSCIDPNMFCPDAMQQDVEAAQFLRAQYVGRFLELRHEDVASDPRAATILVMNFLKRPSDQLPDRVDHYLRTHTTAMALPRYLLNSNKDPKSKWWKMKNSMQEKRKIRDMYEYMMQYRSYRGMIPMGRPEGNDPYSTRRDSQSTIDRWKKSLDPMEIANLQQVCYPVLQYYNYDIMRSQYSII